MEKITGPGIALGRLVKGFLMGKRILIVNDDLDILGNFKLLLETMGIEAVTMIDPEQALDAVTTQTFDLIVVDYRMEGMNGLEFAAKAKERTKTRIAIWSAFADSELKKRAFVSGIPYVINKDGDVDVILKQVTQLVQ